jgi:hypothetical protein
VDSDPLVYQPNSSLAEARHYLDQLASRSA